MQLRTNIHTYNAARVYVLYVRMYVCLFTYNSVTAGAIASKFSGLLQSAPGMFLGARNLGVISRGQKIWHFSFLAAPAGEAWAVLGSLAYTLG